MVGKGRSQMVRPEHWEPPDPPKLLVSAKRVAQDLDIPIWKANELCWCLERVFYSPGQGHYRVTRASLDAFKELLEQGLSMAAARAVMWQYKERGHLPPQELDRKTADGIYWRSRRRK
jgi:hypothetical protein